MRKLFLLGCCVTVWTWSFSQQIPFTPVDNLNMSSGTLTIHGPFEMFSPYLTPGPVTVNNTAQVDFIARDRIHLQPGFRAGAFNGNGYFHAQVGVAADFDVVFIEPNSSFPQVGQFEKLEMGVKLPLSIQSQIDLFLSSGYTSGMNPYDPEQISLEVSFSNGTQTYYTYGFYYLEFLRDPNTITAPYTFDPLIAAQWNEQPTDYPWRIRWAPPLTGLWNCTISVRLNNALTYAYEVPNIQFNCVGSANQGWLEKGQSNWHLRYSGTHQSFFALGQNIAWNGSWPDPNLVYHPNNMLTSFYGQYAYLSPNSYLMYTAAGYMDVLKWTDDLAENGGNMVRFVSRPASYNIEWENLNNYHQGMPRAWELDRMFDLCESRNMKIFFCMEFHPEFGNWSDEAEWDFNPYNVEILGLDHPDHFLTNAEAKKKYKAKLRYFLARWGYSTSLGVFELLSEMDGWRYQGGGDFVDNDNAQLLQASWHGEMLQYVKLMACYRPMLTSSCYGALSAHQLTYPIFDEQFLDITTFHAYEYERNANIMRYDEFNKQGTQRGTLTRWPSKPTVFDEIGISDNEADPDDVESCSDVTYHNALWASSMMGGIGTGFYWWQWSNDAYRAANFPALSGFFSTIDFESGNFTHPGFWDNSTALTYHSNSTLEVFYNTANSRDKTMGWVHNTTYWWGNMISGCYDRSGQQMSLTDTHDDNDYSEPYDNFGTMQFEIHGLNNLANYTTEFWDTRTPNQYGTFSYQTNIFGTLKPYWISGAADRAIKAYRAGNNFRSGGEITHDTLRCGELTVYAEGNHEADTLGNLLYYWNFGNGQTSNLKNDTAEYVNPGTYLVRLIVSDTLGWADTLMQYITVPACSAPRLTSDNPANNSLLVFPNPTTGTVSVVPGPDFEGSVDIRVISLFGQTIMETQSVADRTTILDLSELSSGIYYISVSDQYCEKTERISIVH